MYNPGQEVILSDAEQKVIEIPGIKILEAPLMVQLEGLHYKVELFLEIDPNLYEKLYIVRAVTSTPPLSSVNGILWYSHIDSASIRGYSMTIEIGIDSADVERENRNKAFSYFYSTVRAIFSDLEYIALMLEVKHT